MKHSKKPNVQEFLFKNRGAALALPALALAVFGRPSAFSVTLGLPLAIAGELLRIWAVGYSGVTTRSDTVTAAELITAGPYAYVRNPLYLGNFVTATGFAIAFTGANSLVERTALISGCLGFMAAVYATIIPHEEKYLRVTFGEAFVRYCDSVPALVPQLESNYPQQGTWKPRVIAEAETKTFATFGIMLAALAVKALLV